jgi:hypothetical protein
VYGPGEFFFESGNVNHTVFNKTSEPNVRDGAGAAIRGPRRCRALAVDMSGYGL